jgi:hypothetical protein
MDPAALSSGLKEGVMPKQNQNMLDRLTDNDFESYFKIGVSDDFILIRRDFPIKDIPPSNFSRMLTEMFRRNDEVRHGK